MKFNQIIKISTILLLSFISIALKSQTPNKNGLSKTFSEEFTRKLNDSIPSIGSFIVSKNNKIIYEQYFNGANNETIFNVKSVTKSITSVLAGIARDKGILPDINTSVLKILPEYDIPRTQFKNISNIEGKILHDSIRKTVTLRHLMTMQGGFDYIENSQLSTAMGFSSDPVRFMLDLPFEEYPGDKFNYSSGETHVFGVALSRLVKSRLKDFADKNLFNPLSIKIERWDTDALNRNLAGSELFMKANDMLKFGTLILNNGKFGNRQIVSQKWIEESTSEQVKLDNWDVLPNANGYGYYWWRRKTNGHQAFVAVGYGGQIICIIPDLKMVIVSTCFLGEKNRGRKELKKLHSFIDEFTKLADNNY
ncbi:serine hydrolase domain-containing protein [Chryseobacterium oryctis]|uniref:Beta-lactamase family protein n=1 Tax=Chryseobacterium oryctis TaxID=2952618 RepID=A0ABT3HK92_9FLAO|nr:serine hydrolase [Chryseobacterium oryctis]MCW3160181.1 beta-lactamase family protein [Chryseobacterium oryctis]